MNEITESSDVEELTPEEVNTLCSQSAKQDYAKTMLQLYGQYKPFSEEEERDVFSQLQFDKEGNVIQDSAYEKVILHNMRLVIHIAGKCSARFKTPIEDSIHDGTLGLIKAIQKFQLSKGVHFSTYATSWILQSITTAYNKGGRAIKTPTTHNRSVARYLHMEDELRKDLGRNPSIAEVAEELNISVKTAERVRMNMAEPISLDMNVSFHRSDFDGEYREERVIDHIKDEHHASMDEYMEGQELKEQVGILLKDLDDKERFVVTKKYGFDGYTLTDAEIGDALGISRNQVRAILRVINKKLKKKAELLKMEELLF